MREYDAHQTRPVVLITGASSGIGRATASEMGRRGWNVVVGYGTGRDRAEQVVSSVEQCGGSAITAPIDLRDPDYAVIALNRALARSRSVIGDVTCLVNNAGVNDRTPADQVTTGRAADVFTVDALSPIAMASAFARYLIDRGQSGAIVNITSVHETIPITGGTLYCSAKAALGMATKVMALEFAHRGIRVNSIAPGETSTPMNGVPDGYEGLSPQRPAIPARRAGHPDEVAAAVCFLAGAESSYITGASLIVDGGLVLTAAEENARASTSPDQIRGRITL